jgi:phosphoserine phosphatase
LAPTGGPFTFVITLIAKPGKLQPALVLSLRNAWGGESAQWLAADEAAEFAVDTKPVNLWDVWRTYKKWVSIWCANR